MKTVNNLTENLWELNAPLRVLGCQIGHRMTLVRLSGGGLWLHSPVAWTPELGKQLEALGPVKCIVAPSVMHDLFLQPYARQYPKAEFYGAHGLEKRIPGIPFETLPDVSPWPGELEYVEIAGMPKINEVVFCHVPSRTLIVADLLFNLQAKQDPWTNLVMRWNGIYRRTFTSRLFRSYIKDRGAFRASVERILEWDVERIVMGHGEVIESRGKEVLQKVLEIV